ncbi:type II toxin-antitoxin system RelE family toxin [Microbulbifer sp.]|uniref:type II toxin-antitoxin system RelE family toxin n=1 Tax=Microbulbifer sp. TaxID=1908541 RepID=UPI003F38F40A
MSYELKFHPKALKEWKKLGATVREQFKKVLNKRLKTPRVPKDKLSGSQDLYKIKLKEAGYRLVYEVNDGAITITVVVVGKREKGEVYKKLQR